MSENGLGAFIRLTAENFVTIDAEAVEQVFLLDRRFLDESREHRLDRFQFPGMDFEIGVKADEV